MVQILEGKPNFAQSIASALGGGLQAGMSQGSQLASQLALESHKRNLKKKSFEDFAKLRESRKGTGSMGEALAGRSEGNAEEGSGREPAGENYYQEVEDAIASGLPKQFTDILSKQAESQQKKAELPRQEYVKQEYKSLPKFLEAIDAAEDKMPIADISIKLAEEATEDPGKWAAFRDFLSEKTGYEGFRSAKGAELQSAIKQYFLGDLSSIKGGRPNQLIERQLLDAYPRIGRDPISNQKILVGMKMQQEIQREKVKIAREMEENFLSKQGYLPPGFQSMVKKQLKPFAEKVEKNTIKKLDALSKYQKGYESMATKQLRKGETLMLSPDGEYEAIPKESLDEAKEQGYIKLKG